jgi:hypothetical protein
MARIPLTWYPGPGIRHRSRSEAEGRTPSTEDRVRPPENAHIGFASCISRVRVFRRQVPGTGAGPKPRAEHRAPETEPGHRKTRTSGMHPAYPMCGFFEDRWLVPGSRSRAPGTRDPVPDQRRGPDTEHRGPSRKTRTSGMHPDPASIRALRAIHPSPTLLRPFITSSLHYSVTSSPRHSVPSSLRPCTFLHFFGPPSPGITAIFCTFGTGRRNVGAFGKFPRLRMDPDTPPDWHRGCNGKSDE